MRRERLRVALPHQIADPLRVDDLAGGERAARASPETAEQVRELLADDALADQLVGQVVIDQEVVVEEVTERTVTDVVEDRKSTRLNSSHLGISYAVFCLKKKNRAN